MKPAKFRYERPRSVGEAVDLLADAEDAKVLAGGQSLVPVMNFRLAEPAVLVDINRIDDLSGIEVDGDAIVVGATTRTRALETSTVVDDRIPILSHAAGWVGHVQIRNRGTVGGSVAHADPSAELVAMCILFDAELSVATADGVRVIAAADFFQGLLTTALEPEDLLLSIRFPIPSRHAVWGFREYAQRPGDFALTGVACVVEPDLDQARVVAFGPSSRPLRCPTAEEVLRTAGVRGDAAGQAADAALADVAAGTQVFDLEGRHRVQLVRAMTNGAVADAAQMAEAKS